MNNDQMEQQIMAAVQHAAQDAKDPTVRKRLNAAVVMFAALRKRDEREREAWAIVREVAHLTTTRTGYCPYCSILFAEYGHTESCPVERASKLLAKE